MAGKCPRNGGFHGRKTKLMGKFHEVQLGDFPASHVSLPKGKQMFQSMLAFWVKKLKIHVRLFFGFNPLILDQVFPESPWNPPIKIRMSCWFCCY